jgi:hypothetical protein
MEESTGISGNSWDADADGFHRVKAATQAKVLEIQAEIHQGTREDAQWYSFSANKTNGLRRTNSDKHRAVRAALAHPKAAGLSDAVVARHVGVSDRTVAEYRKVLTPKLSESSLRTGRDGRTVNVTNIGKGRLRGVFVPAAPQRTAGRAGTLAQGRCISSRGVDAPWCKPWPRRIDRSTLGGAVDRFH